MKIIKCVKYGELCVVLDILKRDGYTWKNGESADEFLPDLGKSGVAIVISPDKIITYIPLGIESVSAEEFVRQRTEVDE